MPAENGMEQQISPMGFSELTVGPDVRYGSGIYHAIPIDTGDFYSTAAGITGRMQSSFVRNYLRPDVKRRIHAGDVIACELSLGGIATNQPLNRSGIWIAYRFEFGMGIVSNINQNNDIGITFTLLRFSRDRVSQNISGSDVRLRYRYKNIMAETSLEVRRDRIAGWLLPLTGNTIVPLQHSFVLKYLIEGNEQAGIRFEILSGERNVLQTDYFDFTKIWSVKLFYGIYF